MTPLVKSKGAEKRSHIQRSKAKETEYIPLVKCPPLALEIDRCDLPIRVNRDEVCPSGHARSQLFSCQSRKIAGTLQDHERSVNSLECVQTQADARRAEGPATAGVSWPRSARHPSPVEVRVCREALPCQARTWSGCPTSPTSRSTTRPTLALQAQLHQLVQALWQRLPAEVQAIIAGDLRRVEVVLASASGGDHLWPSR